nr:carbohydrate ABC transporter substrate-binding protein [Arachnia sp.]
MRSTNLMRITAAAGVAALALAACSPSTSPTTEPTGGSTTTTGGGEQITLTVATFNEFGYDDLLAEYNTLNPNVKAVEKKAATSDEARENFMTK